MRQIRGENDNLKSQNSALRDDLKEVRTANAKLSTEVEDLQASGKRMQSTIRTLTSKEDSLARQYLELKQTKENLENITLSVESLNTRVVEESSVGGIRAGKVELFIGDTLLGFLDWRLPENLGMNEATDAEARFTSESIDFVRVAEGERHILQSLGDKMKLRVLLASRTDTLEIRPEHESALQEVGERESADWRWLITNQGSQDSRLLLAVNFVNKNTDNIPVLNQEYLVRSSNIVREVRGYLQPIPLALGAILGFLLFGIVGIFRRGRRSRPPSHPREQGAYIKQKRL
jgi:hypothetical protein